VLIDWSPLSPETLRTEAAAYRHDNDDGSCCFFDARDANWHYQMIEPKTLNAFADVDKAEAWIRDEIALLRAEGMDSADRYEAMLLNGFHDPVIVGRYEASAELWDGYHRTAIAIVRNELLPAIVGIRSIAKRSHT
jgi:hypothetical protein